MAEHFPDQVSAAHHFLAGCAQAGLRRVILSPGSRSTPLTLAADAIRGIPNGMHLDERSAAFAALGEAKATGEPVAIVCTSGTAAANYLPAIAEAAMSGVPIIAITADRPPEHIGWGVGQAFDQTGLFANHVRAELRMPVGADGGLHHAVRAGYRATATAVIERGPVHVNWPFRLPVEPLGVTPDEVPIVGDPVIGPRAEAGSDRAAEHLRGLLATARRPLLIAGPEPLASPDRRDRREAVATLARRLGLPVIADAASGIRGKPDVPLVDCGPLVLSSGRAPEPDLLIRVGDAPTAKPVRLWWESLGPGVEHLLVDPDRRWQDPSLVVTSYNAGAPFESLDELGGDSVETDWTDRWMDCGKLARGALDTVLDDSDAWTEAHMARELGRSLDESSVVVAASSMPVRDVDTFFPMDAEVEVLSNRGINGIDGVIATAVGVARARPNARVVVHIGDVALLHDVGSVLDAVRQAMDLTVLVPNNDGGGIFSFLPIRDAIEPARFDRLFHTSHGTTFEFLAGIDGVDHRWVDGDSMRSALGEASVRAGVSVLESPVSTPAHLAIHAAIAAAVRRSLA